MTFRLRCLGSSPPLSHTEHRESVPRATRATHVAVVAAVAVTPAPADSAVRTLEARRSRVAAELQRRPELRVAFDVDDPPGKSGAREPVSVVLAVRHGEQILSGEVHIPREPWSVAAFLAAVDTPERPQ